MNVRAPVLALGLLSAMPAAGQPLPPPRPDAAFAGPRPPAGVAIEDGRILADRVAPAPVARPVAPPGAGAVELGDPVLKPGSFAFEPTRLPGPFLREKLVAPRTDPPIEVGIGRRSSVGVFGDVGPVDPKGTAPVRVLNRDVGAGVTFQYRFGGD